ncbi:MAG: metal-dependent hydrolase [Candidatus Andersenbacteria bacterium]|nr:metal-dependent hydrolase [Candidatus Andersenbacteria bacterium]
MFFDIGIGLLVATIFGVATGSESPLLLLGIGVAGALWPDLDFSIWLARHKKVDHLAHRHRDLLHRPLALMPPLTLVVWLALGWQAGALFGITTVLHFIHDTIGHGWGIKWLWPLNNHYWCFRSFGGRPVRLYAWTLAEQDELPEKYGNRNWAKEVYSLSSPNLKKELYVLSVGVLVATAWCASTFLS